MKIPIPVLLFLTLLFVCVPPVRGEKAAAPRSESEQMQERVKREELFLRRALEDLQHSQEYAQTMIGNLRKQIDAVEFSGPSGREEDIDSLLAWYRSYADWLNGEISILDRDLSMVYSGQQRGQLQPARCRSIAEGYAQLGSELGDRLGHLERLEDRTRRRRDDLRDILEYLHSTRFIEARKRDRARKKREKDSNRRNDLDKDEMYERYRDIRKDEIRRMELELRNLEELQEHYAVLLETGRLERSWIGRQAGDYDVLTQLARNLGAQEHEAVAEANSRMIGRYESDIAFFKGELDHLRSEQHRLVPSGSLNTLDRRKELADNYDEMQHRFEQHVSWLAQQIGAYRADSIQAGR